MTCDAHRCRRARTWWVCEDCHPDARRPLWCPDHRAHGEAEAILVSKMDAVIGRTAAVHPAAGATDKEPAKEEQPRSKRRRYATRATSNAPDDVEG